ncbi:MAG: hypothetical protein WBR15_00160 [Gammaproteobacteria bacterium]
MRWQMTLCPCLLASILVDCSIGPINVSNAQILNAKANHVPVVIYGTSFNNANNQGDISGLSVQFLITSDEAVQTIILFVRTCKGATGQEEGPIVPLSLIGPFQANTAYLVNPRFPFSESQQWQSRRSWHLIIKGVEAIDTTGSSSMYANDLSPVLTKKIANYCSTILFPNSMNGSLVN